MSAPTLTGLQVAAFESRRADDLRRMLEKFGAVAHVSPSMREVPIEGNREAIDFANRLISGQFEIVILMTGVGIRNLLTAIERHVDRQAFLDALSDVTTICRGPKPTAVLKELGLKPTYLVPEPNTWRELLHLIDQELQVDQQAVALLEFGIPSLGLMAGLEARGARITTVRVYQWELPEDTGPLEANIREIVDGKRDVAMFTSSPQVLHMLEMAGRLNLDDGLRQALAQMVIASVGPSTSETLRAQGLSVDLEPPHPKMGHLVQTAAERAADLLSKKRNGVRIDPVAAAATVNNDALHNSLFLRACRREPVERTPIWMMRQAGRYMAEYREVRAQTTFLELCKNPQMCAEVMITAVERLKVDAAIIFSDLLPILEPMGLDLEFAKGEGPIIHNPVREAADVNRVVELDHVESLSFVTETVRLTRAGLPADLPLIGFAGAPFTLASYVIEGGSSRNYLHTKTLMYRDEGAWNELLGRLARSVGRYLNAQIAAGAQAVQIFDSWVGCLGPVDYRRYVLPHTRAVIEALPRDVPVIHFGAGNPALLPHLAEAGGSVLGVDWRISLDDAWQQIGYDRAVQGNLDPLVLLARPEEIRQRAKEVLDQAAGRPGHIFNLGHGIVPQTPVENAIALVEAVRELSSR